jgi:putative ABC transport system permease protein
MMGQTATWVKGTLLHRFGRLLGAIIGVALTVAFIASLGEFLTAGNAQLTRRAIHDVPVDWQIQTAPGVDTGAVRAQIEKTVAPRILHQVFYASVDGFRASTGGTVQTTGPGKALGMSDQYFRDFPQELRPLLGPAGTGARVAQQLAANLHVTVGDSLQILRVGLPPASVKVDGVVDLLYADSLFQAVGVPAGIAPQAPPDNVIILPDTLWRTLFQPQALIHPDSVRTQFHARLGHPLPNSPTAAYMKVTQDAKNLEARIAGSGIVGDNLGARLLSVTSDSLYASVLFLFLGLPGMILTIVLTLAVAASGGQRRASEQALLRARGASVGQIVQLEIAEAILAGVGGLVIGTVLALAASRIQRIGIPGLVRYAPGWIAGASLVGLALALGALVVPAWVQARQSTVAAARRTVKAASRPLWQRMWLDVIILAVGAVELWRTASTGYAVVLAPEGVAANSVNYEAFVAPVCLWIGGVLLSYRLLNGGLRIGRRALSRFLAPLARSLSDLVAASLSRQRGLMTRGTVLVALAAAFAVSTAVFDTTYNAQSRVDAELTNGSDVTVTGPTGAAPGTKLGQLKAIPGVVAAQAMQHRFAYVGNDLQDVFGINPRTIEEATMISNAFFSSGNAKATLDALARTTDGVLVSEETRVTYQLNPGDPLNLRIQFAADHKYHVVQFHVLGVVREFPTAPKDSFLVANSLYLAQQTGTDAAETVLLHVRGDPAAVARKARSIVSDLPGVEVSDLGSVQRAISSGLTAVNLRSLTRLELVFAVLLVTGAAGLSLGLGLAERRRMFAILTALGANARQLGAFLWSEALLMLVGGMVVGGLMGVGVADVLVKMLTGIFDPPPDALAIPLGYLGFLGLAAVVSTIAAVIALRLHARREVLQAVRGL